MVVEEVARFEAGTPAPNLPAARRAAEPSTVRRSGVRERSAAAVARSLVTGVFEPVPETPEAVAAVTRTFAAPLGAESMPPATTVPAVGKPIDLPAGTSAVMSGVTSSVTLPGHSGTSAGSYTVQAPSPLQGITALRLEALPHPSLPHEGPGRFGVGNFHLTEISLATGPPDAVARSRPVAFARAAATYRRPPDQLTTARDGPHGAIDRTHSTRWDVWPLMGRPHAAFSEVAEPFGTAGDALYVNLDFRSAYAHNVLGRFRLSVTTRANVARDENLIALAEGKGAWARLGGACVTRGE